MSADYLFVPLQLGALSLPNRIVMPALTRMRAGPGGVPLPISAEYHAQRASAGLIVTEATAISVNAHGYPQMPGIYSPDQIAGWRRVTEAVHARGGRIVLQIVHHGRWSHSSYNPDGSLPVAPSAIAAPGPRLHAGISTGALRDAACAGNGRDIGDRRGLLERSEECTRCQLRRCRDPWCERLPARSIPAGRQQSSRRRVWRFDRKPDPAIA